MKMTALDKFNVIVDNFLKEVENTTEFSNFDKNVIHHIMIKASTEFVKFVNDPEELYLEQEKENGCSSKVVKRTNENRNS